MMRPAASITGGTVAQEWNVIAFSDPHGGFGKAPWIALRGWVHAQGIEPDAVVNVGDSLGPEENSAQVYADYLHALAPGKPVLEVPGNHDGLWPIGYPKDGTVREPVFAPHVREWSSLEAGPVLLIAINNLCPNPDAPSGDSYHNVNPPGNPGGNADRSGWTDPNSEQRQWIRTTIEGSSAKHVWIFGHRAFWNVFGDPGRRNLEEGREGIEELYWDYGIEGVISGDQHCPSLMRCDPMTGAAGEGPLFANLHGNFAPRDPDFSVVDPDAVLYAPEEGLANRVVALHLRFVGGRCRVRVVEVNGTDVSIPYEEWLAAPEAS